MADRKELLKELGRDLLEQLREQAAAAGKAFQPALDEVQDFIAAKAEELSAAYGKPGFDEALIAARDSVLLKAAGRAVIEADKFDEMMRTAAYAGLRITALLLARI